MTAGKINWDDTTSSRSSNFRPNTPTGPSCRGPSAAALLSRLASSSKMGAEVPIDDPRIGSGSRTSVHEARLSKESLLPPAGPRNSEQIHHTMFQLEQLDPTELRNASVNLQADRQGAIALGQTVWSAVHICIGPRDTVLCANRSGPA